MHAACLYPSRLVLLCSHNLASDEIAHHSTFRYEPVQSFFIKTYSFFATVGNFFFSSYEIVLVFQTIKFLPTLLASNKNQRYDKWNPFVCISQLDNEFEFIVMIQQKKMKLQIGSFWQRKKASRHRVWSWKLRSCVELRYRSRAPSSRSKLICERAARKV